MRKNTREVFEAWRENKALKKCRAVWTDGSDIYSYATKIVHRHKGIIYVNTEKYSITTTIHQNGLRSALQQAGIDYSVLG